MRFLSANLFFRFAFAKLRIIFELTKKKNFKSKQWCGVSTCSTHERGQAVNLPVENNINLTFASRPTQGSVLDATAWQKSHKSFQIH